ncbi:MAG: hypothetical protein KAY32_02300 [Candidatus Eisenbacteria sp.]|nr:hypothetical protein [Candidatus Eisenbacteria bacterium]
MEEHPPTASGRSPLQDPVAEIVRIVIRTLWILFAGFCLAPAAYLLVLLAIAPGEGAGMQGLAGEAPAQWDQWQFLFAATGIVCIYASFRLRRYVLNPTSLRDRALQSVEKEAAARGGGALPQMIQGLIGRLALGHVLLWALVEIPAILGVVDRFVSGETRFFVGLVILTGIGLYAQRPSRKWIAGLLHDVLRAR